ncbi:MAG TPA: hypothetical protein VK709_04785 [Candidatus Saccharimonadales bacterium]|jgi:hypothetical protein|nr:hypothetical protein [Candidatus Saccharimonadales bacterium]
MSAEKLRKGAPVAAMTERSVPNLEAVSFIGKHSVAFLLPDKDTAGGVRLKASGSLVTFDQRHFILTANHVWAELRKSPIIQYSAIADISHDVKMPREALTAYVLDDNLDKELGCGKSLKGFDADLTLLELHPVDFRKIEIRSSFFPLGREAHGVTNDWLTIGAPGVLAQKDSREINTLTFEVRAIFLDTLTQEPERNGLDFLRGLPYEDPIRPVQDYRGMSGGGLWSLSFYPDKLAGERYEVFLIGVIFWQKGKEIRCLGRKAINQMIQRVRKSHQEAGG